jgi:hypothetical protein
VIIGAMAPFPYAFFKREFCEYMTYRLKGRFMICGYLQLRVLSYQNVAV